MRKASSRLTGTGQVVGSDRCAPTASRVAGLPRPSAPSAWLLSLRCRPLSRRRRGCRCEGRPQKCFRQPCRRHRQRRPPAAAAARRRKPRRSCSVSSSAAPMCGRSWTSSLRALEHPGASLRLEGRGGAAAGRDQRWARAGATRAGARSSQRSATAISVAAGLPRRRSSTPDSGHQRPSCNRRRCIPAHRRAAARATCSPI